MRTATTPPPAHFLFPPPASPPPTPTGTQIIGKYALGPIIATGDFDCSTRFCTHIVTGALYVVRIYEKGVLDEADWMRERVQESIRVQRTLSRHPNVIEMVECLESQTAVYILMYTFPSTTVTKLFVDGAARRSFMQNLLAMPAVQQAAAAVWAKKCVNADGPRRATIPDLDNGGETEDGEEKRGAEDGVTPSATASLGALSSVQKEVLAALNLPQWSVSLLRQCFPTLGDGGEGVPPDQGSARGGDGNSARPSFFDGHRRSTQQQQQQQQSFSSPPQWTALPLPLVRFLFKQVVRGVLHLHEHCVVHMGIAPDHVLVGANALVKISNLVSCCFCPCGDRFHELRGTRQTVAPEVLKGEAYDPYRADAWSLGVLLYFMTNDGRYPHDGANTLRHILHGHTRSPKASLPHEVKDLMERLLQRNPEERLPVDAILSHPFFEVDLAFRPELSQREWGSILLVPGANASSVGGGEDGYDELATSGRYYRGMGPSLLRRSTAQALVAEGPTPTVSPTIDPPHQPLSAALLDGATSSTTSQQQMTQQLTRPAWRPAQAPTLEALQNQAAAVLQYHFRLRRMQRAFRAGTQALIAKSRSPKASAADRLSPAVPPTLNLLSPAAERENEEAGDDFLASTSSSLMPLPYASTHHVPLQGRLDRKASVAERRADGAGGRDYRSGSVGGGMLRLPQVESRRSSVAILDVAETSSRRSPQNPGHLQQRWGTRATSFSFSSSNIQQPPALSGRAGPRRTAQEEEAEETDEMQQAELQRLLSMKGVGRSPRRRASFAPSGGAASAGASEGASALPAPHRPSVSGQLIAAPRRLSFIDSRVHELEQQQQLLSMQGLGGGHHRLSRSLLSAQGGGVVGEAETCPLCRRPPYTLRPVTRMPYIMTKYSYNEKSGFVDREKEDE